MNIWHDINPERITPEDFISVIEIPKGSKNKYEVDKQTGMLILDRILYTSTHYPANYGFIPRTYADDGDPIDVLVLCSEAISSMSLVRCYPIGHITMIDDGAEDIKVVAVPVKEPTWNCYQDIADLPPHVPKRQFQKYHSFLLREERPPRDAFSLFHPYVILTALCPLLRLRPARGCLLRVQSTDNAAFRLRERLRQPIGIGIAKNARQRQDNGSQHRRNGGAKVGLQPVGTAEVFFAPVPPRGEDAADQHPKAKHQNRQPHGGG